MATPQPSETNVDPQDRIWHFLWGLAGSAALIYGLVGVTACLSQPNRHSMALVWFIVAAVGGLSMISFVWRSGGDS